jgi:hypothetical protein
MTARSVDSGQWGVSVYICHREGGLVSIIGIMVSVTVSVINSV